MIGLAASDAGAGYGSARQRTALLGLAALACAFLLLAGKWSPARYLGYGVNPPLYLDLRLYLLLACTLVMPAMGLRFTRTGVLTGVLLAGLVTLLLTAFFVPDPWSAYLAGKVENMVFIGWLMLVFYAFGTDPDFEARLWSWTFRIGLVFTALASAGAAMGTIAYDSRLMVLGGDGNFTSRILGAFAILCIYRIARGDPQRWFYPLAASAALLTILLTGSRGGVLAAAIGCLIVIGMCFRARLLPAIALPAAALPLLAMIAAPETLDFLRLRYLDQLLGDFYLAQRDILYARAIELWQAEPWLGHGLGGFSRGAPEDFPHNLVLELLCEFGVVGAAWMLLPLVALLVVAAMHRRWVDPRTVAVLALYTVTAQSSGDLFDSRGVFVLAIVAATGACARAAQRQPVPGRIPEPGPPGRVWLGRSRPGLRP